MIPKNNILFVTLLIFASVTNAAKTLPHDGIFTIKTVKGTDESGHFSLQYPVLASDFKSENREKINAFLKKEFIDDRLCTKDVEKQALMQSLSTINIKYVSEKIISVITKYDIYCGGPYPEIGEMYATYNLSSGVKLDLLSEVKNPPAFKSFLAKQFQQHIPSKASEECRDLYSTEELLQLSPQFLLTAETLSIKADYMHAAKSCEFDIAIKRCTVNQFLKSDSILFTSCPKS